MKKFILKCLYTIFPVMLLIYAYGFYVNVYLIENVLPKAGDLGNLGYFYIDKSKTNLGTKLFENKVDTYYDSIPEKYNIITIGDSFSQQGFSGYQNYLATTVGERVLNFPDPREKGYNSIEISLYLLNNDIYNKLGCKTVIIETVEREFVQHLLSFRNIKEINYTIEREGDNNKKNKSAKKRDYLMETFKYIKFQLYKSKRPVKEAQLNIECFSVPPQKTLYFYKDDLWKLSIEKEEMNKIHDRLNYLNKRFQEKGIKLYYLIAPDKYDVFQPYIVNNPYRPKTVIDQLEENGINELEWVINPRNKFREMISNGIKDVYHIDDTHWATIASETVGNIIADKINQSQK